MSPDFQSDSQYTRARLKPTRLTQEVRPMVADEPLDPSSLAQFYEHDRCPRYLKQRVNPGEEEQARDWNESYTLMNSALIGAGREFEAQAIEALAENAVRIIGPELTDPEAADVPDITIDETWGDSARGRRQQLQDAINTAANCTPADETVPYVLLYQVPLSGEIGEHELYGDADCIAVAPADCIPETAAHTGTDSETEDNTNAESGAQPTIAPTVGQLPENVDVAARVIDIKSARDQRPGHRIQVAVYALLLEQTLGEGPDTIPTCHIEGGVLTRELATETALTTPFVVPPFAHEEWGAVVEQLLAANGPVSEAIEDDLESLPYALDQVCNNCAYKETCATRAAETPTGHESLALLGIDARVQRTLREAGIESLEELATLAPPVNNPWPTDEPPTLALPSETRQVLEDAVSQPVYELIQRAQVLYSAITPEYDGPEQPQPIPGTGWVQLPDDQRAEWIESDEIGAGELINVALVVRPDPTLDRVAALGAAVSAAAVDEVQTIGEVIDVLPEDDQAAATAERQLLDRFTEALFEAIERVAATLGRPEQSALHCYTYSTHEHDALVEALDRHGDTADRIRALRGLCSLDPDGHTQFDQEMWTAVQPVLNEHFALQYPSQGLVQVAEQFIPGWSMHKLDPLDNRENAPPLWAIFREQWLNSRVPYLEDSPGVRLNVERGPLAEGTAAALADTDDDDPSPAGWYPVRKRAGTQFPVEYLWAVTPRSRDDDTPRLTPDIVDTWALDEENESLYRQEIKRYYYRTNAHDEPLQRSDLTYLLERLSATLLELIDAVPAKDQFPEKTPIDATDLAQFRCPSTRLSGGLQDYLRMEHGRRREEILTRYRQPLRARIRSGYAVPIECTAVEQTDDGGLRVEAELAYEAVVGTELAAQLRTRARLSAGQWRVLTPLQAVPDSTDGQAETAASASEDAGAGPSARGQHREQVETTVAKPTAIRHSPPAVVDAISYTEQTLTLQLLPHRLTRSNGARFHDHIHAYRETHCGWAAPEAANVDDPEAVAEDYPPAVSGRTPVQIEPGERFVLDQMIDDLNGRKAERAVTPAVIGDNACWQHLAHLSQTGQQPPVHVAPTDGIADFLDRVTASAQLLTPTADQQAFIRAIDRPIVPLQGPAGAGKTSGALVPALLARAWARWQTGQPFTAFVVAPSHEAVDTAFDTTIEWTRQYQALVDEPFSPALTRVRPTVGKAAQSTPAADGTTPDTTATVDVTRCGYTDAAGVAHLAGITDDLLATASAAGPPPQHLLFATPTTLYRVLETVADTTDRIDGDAATAAMGYTPGLADVVCIDEASMVALPQLFLATSALAPDGQVLIGGDHRQLPTVTAVDWTTSTRQSVVETGAYRSALAYLRWVNDQDGGFMRVSTADRSGSADRPDTSTTTGEDDDD